MSFEDIGYQLVNKLLGALSALYQWRSLAEGNEDFIFANGLINPISYFDDTISYMTFSVVIYHGNTS